MNRISIQWLATFGLVLFLFNACTKDDSMDPDPDPDPEPSTEPLMLECRYESDVTLTDHNPTGIDYIADCSIEVYNGTMTIEPGTTIAFEAGTLLDVGIDGDFVAVGTADKPILFTSVAGDIPTWKGIFINSDNPLTRMEHCIVENAGSSTMSVLHGPAAVAVWENASFVECTFRNNGGAGLLLFDDGANIIEFSNNTFTGNQTFAMEVDVEEVSKLDFPSCIINGNGSDVIAISTASDRLYGDHSWIDAGVPYLFLENIFVYGAWTLEEGAHLQMSAGKRMEVYFEDQSLTILGNENNPVIIEGKENIAGYWDGIEIASNNVKNNFSHLTIRNGGAEALTWADQLGNIGLWNDSKLTVDHLISESTPECDIVLYDTDSTNFTISESPAISVCDN